MAQARDGLLILDANILIDFCESDPTVLLLVSQHIGQVHVPLPTRVRQAITLGLSPGASTESRT